MHHWLNGEHKQISLDIQSAYHAQCGTAMFLSESIRSFQNHVINMMSLQMIDKGYMDVDLFFNTHPMAHTGTWQALDNDGKQFTGLMLLKNPDKRSKSIQNRYDTSQARNREHFRDLKKTQTKALNSFYAISKRMSRISKTWMSHFNTDDVTGSWDRPPATIEREQVKPTELLESFEYIGYTAPQKQNNLRGYELTQTGPLRSITEPEIEAANNQIEDFSTTEDIASPVQAALSLENDQVYISDLISKQIKLREQQTGKQYELLPIPSHLEIQKIQ